MKAGKRFLQFFPWFALVIGLDQLTKALIQNRFIPYESISVIGQTIKLTFVWNPNAAFGINPLKYLPFADRIPVFAIFSLVAAGLVLYLYWKSAPEERATRFGLTLILGGAVGNMIDRVRFGRVVDFVDCDFPDFIIERWPVFNVADSAITVGVALLLFLSFTSRKHEKPHPTDH